MFGHIVHCDWSARPQGRWLAEAWREGAHWRARGPHPVGDISAELDRLFALATVFPVLAAYDFPLGLPSRYAERTGFSDFPSALDAFGQAGWADFYRPAARPQDIGLTRPFYPAAPGGARLHHLLAAHGVEDVAALTRRCERGAPGLRAAGCMFWTLGAKQVGKAAIHGWQHVVGPARRRGARLWPFDGPLRATSAGLTLAESYPGDAYRQLGLAVRGKNDPAVLRGVAPTLRAWACARGVLLGPDIVLAMRSGFAPPHGGSDGFDAVVGLFGAIAVARGERPAGDPTDAASDAGAARRWEGWILGRDAARGAEPDA